MNSLREDVEALAATIQSNGSLMMPAHDVAFVIRKVLANHPAADGVVVPRDLFEAMRDDQIRYLGAKAMRGLTDGNDELKERIEQADAILAKVGA